MAITYAEIVGPTPTWAGSPIYKRLRVEAWPNTTGNRLTWAATDESHEGPVVSETTDAGTFSPQFRIPLGSDQGAVTWTFFIKPLDKIPGVTDTKRVRLGSRTITTGLDWDTLVEGWTDLTAVTPDLVTDIGALTAQAQSARDAAAAHRAAVEAVVASNEGIMASVLGSGGAFDTELAGVYLKQANLEADVAGKVGAGGAFDAKLATTKAARDTRRGVMADIGRYGNGNWYIIRESSRAYHLIRELGNGEYLAQSFEDDTTDPGGTRTLRMKTTTRGPLMRQVQANVATFAGGTWSHTPPTDIQQGYKPETVIVNATAGNTYVDIPAGGLTTELHASRRITVPGAGAGGSDLQLTTGTVPSATRVNLTGGTVGTTVTNKTSTFWTRMRRAETAGATATWTTPAGATMIGMIGTRHTNGGLATVTLNGSNNRANALPTAQTLVNSGRYPSSILTTNGGTVDPGQRCLDMTLNSVQYGEPVVFASDLAAGTHTVVVGVTGYQAPNQSGTPNARVFVGGWLWADGTETPTMGGGVDLRVAEAKLLAFDGAQEASVEHNANGAGAQVYVGSKHGYETTTSLKFYIGGAQVTMSDWQVLAANDARIVKTTRLSHPSAPTTDFFEVVYTYHLTQSGLRIRKVTTALAATNVGHNYPFMWSGNGAVYDRAQFDANTTVLTLTAADDSKKGLSESTGITMWTNGGEDLFTLTEPQADRITLGWSDNTKANVQDRALSGGNYKLNKVYIGSVPGAIAAGAVWDEEATYSWSRVRGGLTSLVPLT